VSSRHRRDFLLDSGAVTALATNKDLLEAYLKLLKTKYDGSTLIPMPVVGEFRSGDPRKDVRSTASSTPSPRRRTPFTSP